MDSSFSTPSRRTQDNEIDWASKLKALDQVDTDNAAEERRLQEEIAAARQARQRRSRGQSTGRTDALESGLKGLGLDTSRTTDDDAFPNTPDKREAQETALRKLMGTNNVYNPDKIGTTVSKDEPPSLAAFIGGRASGPRLNKHAPQVDAHDPTQFMQPNLSAPHPVFGKGGVAMPGMVAARKSPVHDSPGVGSGDYEQHRPSATRPLSSRKSMEKIPRTSSTSPLPGSMPQDSFAKPAYEPTKPFSVTTNNPTITPTTPRKSPSTSSIAKKYLEQIEQSNSKPSTPTPATKTVDYTRPSFSSAAFSSPSFGATTLSAKSTKPEPAPSWSKPTQPAVNNVTSVNVNLDDPPPRSPVGSFAKPKSTPAPDPAPTPAPAFGSGTHSSSLDSPRPAFTATKSAPAAAASSVSTPPWDKSNLKPVGTPLSRGTSDSPARATPVKALSIPPAFSANQSTRPTGPTVDSAQNAGLRKIMANNNVYNPDKLPRQNTQPPSLAAFIGGHASGPRLNKHAPQVDAHDPTQFVQPDLNAPHPIFGKGGIAMPGMVGRKKDDDDLEDEYFEEPPKPMSSFQSNYARERTKSTPAAPSARIAPKARVVRDDIQHRNSRPISAGYYPPPAQPDEASGSRPRSFVTTPSLARPVQPEPKPSSFVPRIPAAAAASPAFQKHTSQKEPTPSLSRLKGRGFVQNMVKASFERETSVPRSPSPTKNLTPSRESSVRNRWQPGASSTAQNNTPQRSHTPREEYRPDRAASASPTKLSFHVSDLDFNPRSTPRTPKDRAISASPTKRLKEMPDLDDLPPTSRRHSPVPTQPRSTSPAPLEHSTNAPPEPILQKIGSSSTRIVIKPSKSFGDLAAEGGSPFSVRPRKTVDTDTSRKPLIHPSSILCNQNLVVQITFYAEFYVPGSALLESQLTKTRARKPSKQHQKEERVDSVSPLKDIGEPEPRHEERISPIDNNPTDRQSPVKSQFVVEDAPPFVSKPPISFERTPKEREEPEQVDIPLSWEELASASVEDSASESFATPASQPPLDLPPVETVTPRAEVFEHTRTSRSPPPSPSKHKRIPSTGRRPTVMEVALTLHEQSSLEEAVESPVASSYPAPLPEPAPVVEDPPPSVRARRVPVQPEKRRSAYERYSMISLPPLKEELTPVPSPAGTLKGVDPEKLLLEADLSRPISLSPQGSIKGIAEPHVSETLVDEPALEPMGMEIPNISRMLTSWSPPTSDPDAFRISVEVLSVYGNGATVLNKDSDIFYESEVLLIVSRNKYRTTGLASTTVWCWLGKSCAFGDKEEKKTQEVAKRYGTSAIIVHQWAEPHGLLDVLGMTLIIRQGTRLRWSGDNTTMHVVRCYRQAMLIGECDFNVKNLCSGFSYCLTLLDSIYVWHGRGSTPDERRAAVEYSGRLGNNLGVTELNEGVDDDDEIFWMMLGTDEYAKADYWKWRSTSLAVDPTVWRASFDHDKGPQLESVEFISMEPDLHKSVYVIDCVWEIFVLVSKDARADKPAIRVALDAASYLSEQIATKRPYPPTIHTLILPSQIPLDLHMNLRDLDEAWVNHGEIPDHMNLLPYFVAVHQINQTRWNPELLKDANMLPLGVGDEGH